MQEKENEAQIVAAKLNYFLGSIFYFENYFELLVWMAGPPKSLFLMRSLNPAYLNF